MYALTSSLILQLSLDFPNTSAALLKRGPGVTGVQRDQRELIFLGPYSFIKIKQQLKKGGNTDLITIVLELFLIGEIMEPNTASKKCWDAGHRWL